MKQLKDFAVALGLTLFWFGSTYFNGVLRPFSRAACPPGDHQHLCRPERLYLPARQGLRLGGRAHHPSLLPAACLSFCGADLLAELAGFKL